MPVSQRDPKTQKFFSDTPIENAKHFNFDDYVKSIQQIVEYSDISTPFSIAINGKWGFGKTSLMKTLRKELDQNHEKIDGRFVRTVWFNAWKYSEKDAMLASLVREIYDEIERKTLFSKMGFFDRIKLWNLKIYERANTTQQISDLAKVLSLGISPDLTKWQNTSKYERHLPFYDIFQNYMRLILNFFVLPENEGKFDDHKGVLVIFIDDLDRCTPQSVAAVFESINLFFDQEGCIFIFGLDIHLTAKLIESHYKEFHGFSGHEYIKKVIQLQFDLPDLRDNDIKEYFEQELSNDDPLRPYIHLIVASFDRNPRKVKQSLNSLKLMISLGNQIKGLHIEEELLIKWSILNFISSEFINETKTDPQLLLYLQGYSRYNDDFPFWAENYEQRAGSYESPLESELFNKTFLSFTKNFKIIEILRSGSKEFTDRNLSDYIYLSGIIPKNPKITVTCRDDPTIWGRPLVFYGMALISGNFVIIEITGPGEYSNGKEIGRSEVAVNNMWDFTWNPEYSIQPGFYGITVSDLHHEISSTNTFEIQKGVIALVATGDQSYYLGEKIHLFGETTAGDKIYLSLASSDPQRPHRKIDQITIETINDDPKTFVEISINSQKMFEYVWDTSLEATYLSSGIYTIYATPGPFGKNFFENKPYGAVTITLKKPFVSAAPIKSTFVRGEPLIIRGTAEGIPKVGVQFWLFGSDHFTNTIVNVNDDASFEIILNNTNYMDLGQNLGIIQHPMMNNEFDVYIDSSRQNILSNLPKKGTELFSIAGEKSLKGSNAAIALIEALNVKGIDDTYVKFQILLSDPEISVNHIDGRRVGEELLVEGQTNIPVGSAVHFEIRNQQGEIIDRVMDTIKDGLTNLNLIRTKIGTSSYDVGKYSIRISAQEFKGQFDSTFEIFD